LLATNGTEFESVRTVSVVRHYKLGRSLIPAVDGVSLAAGRGEFIACWALQDRASPRC